MSLPEGEMAALARHPAISGLPRDARVLVLGPRPLADDLRARTGWRIETTDRLDELPYEPGSLDGAIVAGVLEHHEWDRWVLQQVHHALADGAPLLLRVPDLTALWTPGGAGFVLGRVRDRLGRRLRGSGPPAPFAGRRYRRAALERMLESLHLPVDGQARSTAAGALVTATRKRPGLARRLRDGDAPEPSEFVRRHALENERFVRIRDDWARRNPAFLGSGCASFDPAGHRGARVLVLAPHADDELVGAAGTLLRLVEQGAEVTIVHATDGGASTALRREPDEVRTTLRLEEAREVGSALGAKRLEFWKQDNRAFRVTAETTGRMRALLEELRPGIVITPFVTDIHPDHFTLNRIFAEGLHTAAFDAERCLVLYSEIWSLVPANLVSDVTALEEDVERLIRMYRTAMKVDDLPHLCESRYYDNACRLLGRPGFAEAFLALPASRHEALMSSVEAPNG